MDYHISISFKCSRRNFMAFCNSVVSMETMLWAAYPSNHSSIPERTERFIFSPALSDQLCGPSSLLFNCDQGTLSPWVKLITHSKTVVRFRMCWASYFPLSHTPSWCLQGQPYLYIGRNFSFPSLNVMKVKSSQVFYYNKIIVNVWLILPGFILKLGTITEV